MTKEQQQEEILANNDIGSGSLYFNRAKYSMDEWAEIVACEFSEWVDNMGYRQVGNSEWRTSENISYTTKQLYSMYLNTL